METDIPKNEVTVTFDDTKVTYDDMEGEPRYLK